jgi:hypothetical protein
MCSMSQFDEMIPLNINDRSIITGSVHMQMMAGTNEDYSASSHYRAALQRSLQSDVVPAIISVYKMCIPSARQGEANNMILRSGPHFRYNIIASVSLHSTL